MIYEQKPRLRKNTKEVIHGYHSKPGHKPIVCVWGGGGGWGGGLYLFSFF